MTYINFLKIDMVGSGKTGTETFPTTGIVIGIVVTGVVVVLPADD